MAAGRDRVSLSKGGISSRFFEKKRRKKLLLPWCVRVAQTVPHALSQSKKVFLLLFVHKKKSFVLDTYPALASHGLLSTGLAL
jgi:hypothetical protein